MTDYYVKNAGDDAKDGLSDANAWETISKVQSTLNGDQSDDTVYFNKGDEWREQYTVAGYGTSGHPFTHDAYGTGADPIINGADLITPGTSWSAVQGTDSETTLPDSWASTDYIYYNQISVTTAGTIQSYDIYLLSANSTHIKCALYTDSANTPANLVTNSESAELTSFTDPGWNTFTVSGGGTVSVATYWIAVWITGGNTKHTKKAGSYNRRSTESKAYGTWPASASGSAPATEGVGFKITVAQANTWQATCTTEPLHIYLNTTQGNPQASLVAVDSSNDWYWTANVLYVYSATDPDTAYTTPGIEAQARDYCVYGVTKNYITVQNLHIKYSNKRGICQNGGQDWIADSNTVEYVGPHNAVTGGGIYFDGTNQTMTILASLGTGGTFENNYCHTAKVGISVSQNDAIIRYNKCKDCGTSGGIKFSGTITGIECYYNIIINCDQGFYIDDTTANIYNNSVYGDSQGRAFRVVSLAGNVKNNIFYATSYSQNVMLCTTPGALTMSNNVYYPEGANFISYGGNNYSTLAAYQSGESQDANSIKDDPVFIDAANDKLSLQSTSPCIDVGVDVSLTSDYAGSTVPAPTGGSFDIGAFEYVKMAPSVATVTASTPSVTPTVQYNSAVSTGGAMGMGISMGM